MDVHGVGVFTAGNDILIYLATHNGLYQKLIRKYKILVVFLDRWIKSRFYP